MIFIYVISKNLVDIDFRWNRIERRLLKPKTLKVFNYFRYNSAVVHMKEKIRILKQVATRLRYIKEGCALCKMP